MSRSLLRLIVLPSLVLAGNPLGFTTTEIPSPHSPVQQWNSSQDYNGNSVDISFGAQWFFTLNTFDEDRLVIDFVVENVVDGLRCRKCSALFIDFRFDQHLVTFKSRKNGVWDEQETRPSPVSKEEKFDLKVTVVEDGLKITIDGYWVVMFYNRHRVHQISEVVTYSGGYVEMDYWQRDPASIAPSNDILDDKMFDLRKELDETREELEELKEIVHALKKRVVIP